MSQSHEGQQRPAPTPPPPGFDNASPATTTTATALAGNELERPKSTSFNNLALALGTGLAECMDDSTTLLNNNNNNNNGVAAAVPQKQHQQPERIHTPDACARQGRHAASRLGGGGGGAGGFDYLNPGGTSHMLIPPADSSYLDKLKAGQGQQLPQQQQQQALHQQQTMQQQHQASIGNSQTMGLQTHPGGINNSNGNNGSSLAQAMAANQQKPVRFTAAMMANAQSGGTPASTNQASAGGTDAPSPILASMNPHVNQELLRQQLLLQQQNNINSGASNSNPFGVTVVEPPSNANSPAPLSMGKGAAVIGMNGDGLLYPLVQQQQGNAAGGVGNQMPGTAKAATGVNGAAGQAQARNEFLLAAWGDPVGGVLAGGIAFQSSGGRASAPPPQSQTATFVPGGMTTVVMNNAAVRAYASTSLRVRVAELSQELGGARQGAQQQQPQPWTTARQGAPVTVLRTLPAGGVPVVLAPTPPPPGVVPAVVGARPPSRGIQEPSPATGGAPPDVAVPMRATAAESPVDPERRERERAAAEELAPFLRGPSPSNKGSGGSPAPSSSSRGGASITRGLAILHASSLHVPDVRSTCEAFGALESFRSDFGGSRGVFFATYHDLRSAQLAVKELPEALNGLGNGSRGGGGGVRVRYCVPLNSSSATDESMIMLTDLPGATDEQDLNQVLSSFGEVRAIHYQANMSEQSDDDLASYLVEFYDVQDARQALLELEQTNPWGGDKSKVKVGTRSPTKRKQGKDLIMLMSCWRQGVVAPQKGGENSNNSSRQSPLLQSQKQELGNDSVGNTASPTPSPSPPMEVLRQQMQQLDTSSSQTARTSHVGQQQYAHQMDHLNQSNTMGSTAAPSVATQSYYQQQYPHQGAPAPGQPLQQYQLVVGPDGQYSYVLVNHPPQMVGHPHYGQLGQMGQLGQQMVIDPHTQQQQIMYAPVDQQYQMHNMQQQQQHVLNMNPAAVQHQQYIQYNGAVMPGNANYLFDANTGQLQQPPPTPFIRLPSNDVNSSSLSSDSQPPGRRRAASSTRTSSNAATRANSGSIGSSSSGGNNSGGAGSSGAANSNGEADAGNLTLNIDDVRAGKDRRSSLMVRNIPNKYTQQMLLSEFALADHGPTKMDFFYLPIDFKNKCNRGYAFVNFVDFADIPAFVDQYNGRAWKRFNSEKICDITYARIQGKAAMLKRFENSALMEKDDEYRPKVFVSHGERKGQVESMPMMSMSSASSGGGSGV